MSSLPRPSAMVIAADCGNLPVRRTNARPQIAGGVALACHGRHQRTTI
jgi:hypothetical protein